MQSIPVNQGDLAAWLGVSSSQLSMNSSGRHGPRKLKDAAAAKWATLALTYRQQSAEPTPSPSLLKTNKREATPCRQLAAKAASIAAHCRAGHPVFTGKLKKMQEQHKALTGWIKTLDFLLANLPATKEHKGDRLWADYQLGKAMASIKKYGPAAQAKLRAKIALEKAKAVIYEEMNRKLSGHP
jgi:hypothetical protein